MATNAYLERLNQLDVKKAATVKEQADKILPMNRPLNKNTPPMGSGVPVKMEQPQEEGPNFNNMFGYNFNKFKEEDSRFEEFMQEYTKLAEGMKHEVASGFMPAPIAAQRLQSYLQDSKSYFDKNQPTLMDNPQAKSAIQGMLAGQIQQGQQQQGMEQVQQQMNEPQPSVQAGGNDGY